MGFASWDYDLESKTLHQASQILISPCGGRTTALVFANALGDGCGYGESALGSLRFGWVGNGAQVVPSGTRA